MQEQEDADHIHQVRYNFTSSLEYTENNRFVQNITADITRMNENQQTFTLVGRLAAYNVLLGEAEHNG
jgi:hypothetical protein